MILVMMMMMVTMMIFAACPAGQTQCSTEAYCLDDARFCDRIVDCWEAADEIACSESFISFVFLCYVRSPSSCVLERVFSSFFPLSFTSFCYVRSPWCVCLLSLSFFSFLFPVSFLPPWWW